MEHITNKIFYISNKNKILRPSINSNDDQDSNSDLLYVQSYTLYSISTLAGTSLNILLHAFVVKMVFDFYINFISNFMYAVIYPEDRNTYRFAIFCYLKTGPILKLSFLPLISTKLNV